MFEGHTSRFRAVRAMVPAARWRELPMPPSRALRRVFLFARRIYRRALGSLAGARRRSGGARQLCPGAPRAGVLPASSADRAPNLSSLPLPSLLLWLPNASMSPQIRRVLPAAPQTPGYFIRSSIDFGRSEPKVQGAPAEITAAGGSSSRTAWPRSATRSPFRSRTSTTNSSATLAGSDVRTPKSKPTSPGMEVG